MTYLSLYRLFVLIVSLSIVSCDESTKKEQFNTACDTSKAVKTNPKVCCEKSKAELIISNTGNTKSEIEPSRIINLVKNETNDSMVFIKGGVFLMGASDRKMALKREFPQHMVKVNSFYMDVHEVTNAQFSKFVEATGYITVAEKPVNWEVFKKQLPPNTPKPNDEFLQPGSMVFSPQEGITNLVDFSQWWQWIKGANWKHPHGPNSTIKGKENFPVVHICYSDAMAYANWCGKRLPTEAEWEWAARGGLKNKIYPWGDKFLSNGKDNCNY